MPNLQSALQFSVCSSFYPSSLIPIIKGPFRENLSRVDRGHSPHPATLRLDFSRLSLGSGLVPTFSYHTRRSAHMRNEKMARLEGAPQCLARSSFFDGRVSLLVGPTFLHVTHCSSLRWVDSVKARKP